MGKDCGKNSKKNKIPEKNKEKEKKGEGFSEDRGKREKGQRVKEKRTKKKRPTTADRRPCHQRQKELANLNAEEKGVLQSISALKSAVTVMSKHNSFVQMPRRNVVHRPPKKRSGPVPRRKPHQTQTGGEADLDGGPLANPSFGRPAKRQTPSKSLSNQRKRKKLLKRLDLLRPALMVPMR